MPVRLEPLSAPRKYEGGKVGNPWYKEKPTVANDLREIFLSRLVTPPDPLFSGRHMPCRGAESQSTDRSIGRGVDEVANLSAAQRSTAQEMERVHEGVPKPGSFSVTELDRYELNMAKIVNAAGKVFNPFGNLDLRSMPCGDEPTNGFLCRQLDGSHSVEFRQSFSTTHILKLPVGGSPVQPLANATGHGTPRNARIQLKQSVDPAYHLGVELLSTCNHASPLSSAGHGVQKKDVGNAQGVGRGPGEEDWFPASAGKTAQIVRPYLRH